MRKNTTFIGACKNCDRPCFEDSKEAYIKNHKDQHKIYTHSDMERKVEAHLSETTAKAYQRKSALLKQFFSQLHQRITQIQQKTIRQLYLQSLQESFNVENNINNARKIESLARYADSVIEGKLKQLTCDSTDFLLRGLERADKCMGNGWRPNFSLLNQCLKQSESQIGKITENLRREYLTRMESLDNLLRKEIPQKRSHHKIETHYRDDRNRKKNQQQQTKTILVKNAVEGKQFAIKVRIDKIITFFRQKKQEMVVFIGRDSSGTSFITYKKHEYIKVGNIIKIDMCQIQEHNGKKQIAGIPEAGISLVSEQKQRERQTDRERERERDREKDREREREREKNREKESIKQKQKLRVKEKEIQLLKQKQKPRRNREQMRKQKQEETRSNIPKKREQENRKDRRSMNQETQEKKGEKKDDVKKGRIHEQIEEQNYVKVKQICPDSQNLTLCVKILQVKVQTVSGLICIIGDESGIVNAQLPPEQCVKEGATILITKGQAEVRDQHIIIVVDKNGRVKKSLKNLPKIGLGTNISSESWVQGE